MSRSRAKRLVDLLIESMPFERLSKLGDKPTHAGILILMDHLAKSNCVPCEHLVDFLTSLRDTWKMVDGASFACIFFFLVGILCARLKEGQPARMAILQGTQLFFFVVRNQ